VATHRRGPRHARTREGIALSAVIAAVVTVIALSVAPNQGGANAAVGPVTSPTWTNNIGARVSPQDAGTNGTVLFLNPPSTYFSNRGISPAGDTLWTSPPALPGFVLAQPITDAAGNTYEIEQVNVGEAAGTPGRYDVVARNGSTVLWDVTPDSSYELFQIAVGNGRVYVVGLVPNTLNYELFTLNADTGHLASSSPAVNGEFLDQPFAYKGGLAVLVTSGSQLSIRYYSADGSAGQAYAIPAGYGSIGYRGQDQIDMNGDVYLSAVGDGQTCTQPSIEIIKPGTGLVGPISLGGPCETSLPEEMSTVTPQGFAVVTADNKITVVHPDGTLTTPQPLPATAGQNPTVSAIHANTNGNVLVVQQVYNNNTCAAASKGPCNGLQFDLIDPATGNVIVPVALQQPSGNTASYEMFQPEQGVAFDGSRLYATVNIGTITNYSGTDDLEAFDVPDLGLEYPESQLQGAGASPNPSPTPTPTPTPTVTPDEYQALGDSFSSGEGAAGPSGFLSGTDVPGADMCHRSVEAYPELVKSLSGMPGIFGFHACSGAIIQDFFTPYPDNHIDKGNPVNPDEDFPQLQWLSNRTKVITLSVGGNNMFFPDVMTYCATRAFWQQNCQKVWGSAVDAEYSNIAMGTGNGHDNLPDLYRAIRVKAPNATVYVLGYPRFFALNRTARCFTGVPDRFFEPNDMRWINGEISKFDSLLQKLATTAGFKYINEYNALNGHELCTIHPWINSANLLHRQQSFHPNVNGQAAMAAIFRQQR
jgi:hypothetical protein